MEYRNDKSRDEIRSGLIKQMKEGSLNCLITLSTNKSVHIQEMKHMVIDFQHEVEQKAFRGKAFKVNDTFDYQKYFYFYGFYEQGSYQDNSHFHLLAYLDLNYYQFIYDRLPKYWGKICDSGSQDMQVIKDNYVFIANYVTKQLNQNFDNYLISEKSYLKGKVNG